MCCPTPSSIIAVANLVDGAFYNSGQCCCGIERVYVHEKVYDEFVEGFVAETKNYVVGNPLEQATTMGPMAQARFADLIREQKAEALRKGADAHINMKVPTMSPARPISRPRCSPMSTTRCQSCARKASGRSSAS